MNRQATTTDLTVGRPLTRILLFALPLVSGTIFQQLYSFADTVIVGRFLGVDALAAVGATYSLNFLILGFIQASTVGFGIPISQSFGAKQDDELHRYLWNGWWTAIVMAVIFTVGTLLLTEPLLRLIHTPENIIGLSVAYIRVVFAGIPATMLYNYSASVLRALGDSKHPFYFLLFTSLLNIALDWILIVPLQMGIEGAAFATVISQLISGMLDFWWLYRHTDGIRVRRDEMAFSPAHVGRLCAVGLPMGLEYSFSAIGAVVLQNAINALGSTAVAAQTAGEKIRQMFTLPMESVGMAMATYAGQNLGAKRLDRIRHGIRDGLIIQAVYSAAAWCVVFLIKGWAVGFVLGDTSTAVYTGAVEYLTRISTLFILLGGLMIFRYTLQGMGYSSLAILSGFCELAGRALGSYWSHSAGFTAICYANPLAWGFALVFCAVAVTVLLKRKAKAQAKA